ncbi:MAG: hypothetical protein PHP08_00860 [Candidatus Dojkabacteria bacterium]|nr:hypothetical protein [Candidatus Dojkabacteria bacterium]
MTDLKVKMQTLFDMQILTHHNFRMVVDLSCVTVIRECKRWQPNGEHTNYPEGDTVLSDLNKSVRWALHGFINALQSHVEMIYSYQKALIDSRKSKIWMLFPEYDEAVLIVDALEIYQEWKEDIVKREKEIHGKNWGDASGFNNAIWNDNNKEFMNIYNKKEK